MGVGIGLHRLERVDPAVDQAVMGLAVVGDVVDANLLAAKHKQKLNGEVFNIGNGKNFSINDVADMFGGKKEYGELRTEPFETLADNTKARKILSWKPNGDLYSWINKFKLELGI